MFKNLKPFFSFFLFSLFLFPSFFFFLPSSSQASLVASDSRTYLSDSWTTEQKQATLTALQNKGSAFWLIVIAFGLKKLEFVSGGKDVVFHFDKLAAAFQSEILRQQLFPTDNVGFDFTQIQGEARKQLFQVYKSDTTDHVDGFTKAIVPNLLNEYANSFLESVRPSLLKLKTLGLSRVKVTYYKSNFSLHPLFENINKSYEKSVDAKNNLQQLALLSFSPIPNNAKNILDKAINTAASPWLHTLQNVNAFGLTHLTVDKVSIDVSSLVNSKTQEASKLSLEQIKILKKLQPLALEKLQTQVQNYIDSSMSLNSYKTSIQPTLKNFVNSKIKKIKINNTLYQVDLLLKESNFTLTGSQLPQLAKTQLSALAKVKISPETLKNALLEIYRLTIVDNLNALQDKNISQITINDKAYSLTELLKPENKNKVFTLLSTPAKTELTILAKNTITKTQLDTALNSILEDRETAAKKAKAKAKALQNQKKSKQKKLIIGLSVGGGILTLSSLGGFLYWFFKIKK